MGDFDTVLRLMKIDEAELPDLLPRRRLIRIRQAAEYLSVSEWTLRQMAHNGDIQFIQRTPQSPMLFDLRDLDSWIEQAKQ